MGFGIDRDDLHWRGGQGTAKALRGEHKLWRAIPQHVGQAFGGVVGVQWHIGSARFQGRQDAHHQFNTAFHPQGHAAVGPNAKIDQVVRQPVGTTIQFTVGERLILEDQGQRIRAHGSLPFYLLMDKQFQTEAFRIRVAESPAQSGRQRND